MPLESKTIVDHYEILSLLGSGGMGQVYCALDARLGRKVAIKVLLPSFAEDHERLTRFRHEMQTLAQLSHPNILEIFDTGIFEGSPYLVMECLEGETLRQRLDKGPLSPRKALEAAHQIALGLAAAHEKGIIHRDLKPENLFILGDDRIKILDFGLAKQRHEALPGDQTGASPGLGAEPSLTQTGLVLGTLAYLSPEQVTGASADTRSDIFTFGVVLWEMLYGTRPFRRDSMIETMHSILKEDPEPPSRSQPLPQGLDLILFRCLEKDPKKRFQSAQDLAFALGTLGGSSRAASLSKPFRKPRRPMPWRLVLGGAGLAALAAGLVWLGLDLAKKPQVRLRRLTYQSGLVINARLAPDNQTYLYSVSRQGAPPEIWMGRLDGVDLQRLELPSGSRLLSLSSQAELALLLEGGADRPGTLARVPMTGGTPQKIRDGVFNADWSPDGQTLALVLEGENGRQRLEYPAGNPLFECPPGSRIPFLRVSPQGDQVAFTCGNTAYVVNRAAKRRELARTPGTWDSLAWSREGKQLYLSALPDGDRQEIWTVDLDGHLSLIYSSLGRLQVQDVTLAGRLLTSHVAERLGIQAQMAGESSERDLSCLHSSDVVDLGRDGRAVLFSETREGNGPGGCYLRKAEDPGAARLGSGHPLALSPDGQWALVQRSSNENTLLLLPTGAGKPRELYTRDVVPEWGRFLHDGKHILIGGSAAGRPYGLYILSLDSTELEALPWKATPGCPAIPSPDDSRIALGPSGGKLQLIHRKDGAIQEFAIEPGRRPLCFSRDGASIFLSETSSSAPGIYRLDLASGRLSLWKGLQPCSIRGLDGLTRIAIAPEGQAYAYSYRQILTSDLYLLEGHLKK